MTTLVFEMADINKLIEEIRTAKTFSVTPDQIYDPACYPGEPSLTLRDRLKKRRVKLVGFSSLILKNCQHTSGAKSASRAQSWCIPDH